MNIMNIWLIQIGEPLPIKDSVRKQRLTLLSETLVEREHNVIRWGSSFDHITKTMLFEKDTTIESRPNLAFKIIKGLGYKKNISLRRYLDHQIIARKIVNQAKTMSQPDIILVATPPPNVAYSVVRFARKNNIPVIVDIRDQWPDIFFNNLPKPYQRIVKSIFWVEFRYLKKALSMANALTATMKNLLEWGIRYANRQRMPQDEVFFIGTELLTDTIVTSNINKTLEQRVLEQKNKFIVTFIGTFSRFQNPLIITEVAEKFYNEKSDDIIFILAGAGDYWEEVKNNSVNLPNVILTGWLNQDEIAFLLKHSDVGICPLNRKLSFFPNKVFIYLSAYLPVIASTSGDFKELMEKYNIGLYFEPLDVDGLYRCLKKIINDTGLCDEMRKNIRQVFDKLFKSDIIYDNFVKHIEFVARESIHNY